MSEHRLRAIKRTTLAVVTYVATCVVVIVTGLPQ